MLPKYSWRERARWILQSWHFGGLKVTERQFTHFIKWGGIVTIAKCFAGGSLLSMQLEIVFIIASEIYNPYFWILFQRIMQAPVQLRAHVSKLVGEVFLWVVDCSFYPLLWKLLRRICSQQNLYLNYTLKFVFNSSLPICPFCASSSLPAFFKDSLFPLSQKRQLQDTATRSSLWELDCWKVSLYKAILNPKE